ncbi:MAG: TonB family protein, partial [Candidatus Sulfomarinibacteraceae bacterium]
VWLRVLDGYGLPTEAIVRALDVAREIAGAVTGSQLPSRPFFFDADSVAALGFDYVAGQPLNRALTRARDEAFPLQPDNSLLIVEKIALALAAGEAVEYSGEKLAHGFLHPGLIHLSNDGDATVTGFGLGHALLGSLSTPDAVPGARAYLAPEVLGGAPPSQTGDVYSLGAILFHLLTGTALPVSTGDRSAALDAAHLAWDGEVLPTDIKKILLRSLAPTPSDRYDTASAFRKELDRLLYGGAYSPTTFNLALFMDRLFRAEIEAEELAYDAEREIEVSVDLTPGPIAPDPEPEPDTPDAEPAAPEAVPPPPSGGRNRGVWAAVAAVAVVGIAAVIFWIGRQSGPQEPPPTPTPTAEEISAQRQAQEDRLRTLTQEMVKEMMVEREEAIREELIARQARIEELQLRLQQSERRAKTSTVAAAKEAETQKELMKEIEEQEKAQRQQEEALETERQEALQSAAREARLAADDAAAGAVVAVAPDTVGAGDGGSAPAPAPTMVPPTPSPRAPEPTERPETIAVTVGQFFPPAEADTLPVVIKSQSLEWPRNAARSKGKGVVVVQLTVNATGGVDAVEVLRADHTGWGIPEAAVEAASGYRYKPGTKNGVAITTHAFVTWRYDFTLE